MTSYPGTPLRSRIGRHYDLVSWDAIMTSYPGRHYDLVSWDYDLVSWAITPL